MCVCVSLSLSVKICVYIYIHIRVYVYVYLLRDIEGCSVVSEASLVDSSGIWELYDTVGKSERSVWSLRGPTVKRIMCQDVFLGLE